MGRRPGELKHLSTLRKRDYSLSSGERKGISPNSFSLVACKPMLGEGCKSIDGGLAGAPGSYQSVP
jgi:hypothetical protein